MIVKVVNIEKDSEWSEILKRMKVYADGNELESYLVKGEVPDTKGTIIEELIFTLLMGISVNMVYDLIKMVVKRYGKKKQDIVNKIRIEVEDGDNKKTIEISTLLKEED